MIKRKISCLLLIFLMLNLSFYPAFAQTDLPKESNAENSALLAGDSGESAVEMNPLPTGNIYEETLQASALLADNADGTLQPSGQPPTESNAKRIEFTCNTPESNPDEKVLSPQEVAELKRKTQLDANGFSIDQIDSGKGSNPNREESVNNLVVQKTDNNAAILNQIPDKKMDIGELAPWLNRFSSGPFAFGVSLDDTLRIGQCRNLPKLEAEKRGCPVTDKQLSYRNSGAGITSDFKNVYNDVKDFISEDLLGKEKGAGQYTAEELAQLQTNLASEDDLNGLQAKQVKREINPIENSIKTDNFTAEMATNCNQNSCLVSSYSFFDKYFNSWFSAEMVVTSFGPTLFGQAKRYLGWMRRRGWPWSISDNQLLNKFRAKFMNPDSLIGKARTQRMITRVDKYGFGEFWTPMTECTDWDSGYKWIKGGSARKMINEMAAPGGFLDKLDDPVRKGEFFKLVREMNGYAKTNKAMIGYANEAYMDVLKKFGPGSPEARSALIEYARTNGKVLGWMDDAFSLDAPEWFARDDYAGLYDVGVKHLQSGTVHPLSGDSHHIRAAIDKFVQDGDWSNFDTWGNKAYEATEEGFLQLYKIDPTGEFISEVAVEDLQKNFSHFVDKAALTEKGDLIRIDGTSIDYIVKEAPGTGKVKIYKASWKPFEAETPEKFAGRLTHSRVKGRLTSNFPYNTQRLYDALVEKNFAGKSRHYYSLLDKAFAQEDEILKSYFSVKGGLKWTALPLAYWGGKQGFGFEGMSAYQLPDTWYNVEMYTGDASLFDDAFIDFFANEGSDEGDIFIQVLNKLPWKMVFNYISKQYNPLNDAYEKYTTPGSGWRRTVENVALISSTPEECANCSIGLFVNTPTEQSVTELMSTGKGEARIEFSSNQKMQSYLLEDVLSDKAKEEGTTLIAFGHHTDLSGKSPTGEKGIENGKIDLVEAQNNKETCADKVKKLGLGFLGDDPQRAAAVLAFGETALYAVFFWSGVIGSVVQQTLLAPELQDCVDDKEGYYLHMFAPASTTAKSEPPNQKASEKAGDIIKNVTDFVTGSKGDAATTTEKAQSKSAWEQIKEKVALTAQELSDKAQASTILQASVETAGQTDGIVSFKQLFFYWFKGTAQPAVYDNKTKSYYRDLDNNIDVLIDNEKGILAVSKDGKPFETIIEGKDHTRLATPSSDNTALEIPQRIGQIGLPTEGAALNEMLFEMNWQGSLAVHPEVLDCIKKNVEQQTGVALSTDKITDAFGAVEAIVTTSHPRISADKVEKAIIANGSPREIVYGDNAKATVFVNRKTVLTNSTDVNVGLFQSIQFANGVILYKPETNELIIWLRHNEQSILRQGDVSGLKATPTKVINPETGCPEPAIDLEALPNLEAGDQSAITQRVDNFNKSIEKMGPFQTFDTEKHRFIFYSVKTSPSCDPNAEGCCQERVRIIDKETGEVIDEPLVGDIEKTPTGIKFTTLGPDGKQTEHTLDFSAENGIPKISYDGMPPETLLSATGPNGSFWYDTEKGQWYPENAQMLPLLDAFKQGFDTRHREDCSASTIGAGNTMNVQLGTGDTGMPFNLPSLPEQPLALLLFIVSLFAVIAVARIEIERKFRIVQ
jgi:hypothetical protein